MKKSFAQIVEQEKLDLRSRLSSKVPEWDAVPGISFPSRLNVEQCSSSLAACYKASLAASICRESTSGHPFRIADLTGGLGVDCWAFSQVADEVLYNEADSALADAVKGNFALLGIGNAVFRNGYVEAGAIAQLLGDFAPDLIYLDPARRSGTGRKVFMLQDCSPDVSALQDELLECCPNLLLKLSPMADISMLRRSLRNVAGIHVVSVDGECKELLIHMAAGWTAPPVTTVTVLRKDAVDSMEFTDEDAAVHCARLEDCFAIEGSYIFEPGAALMKSAFHEAACARKGFRKMDASTHLYVAPGPSERLVPFGRFRRIIEVATLDKRSLKDVGARFPRAGVTARNLPLSSEELRSRLGVTDGGDVHIYGATANSARLLFVSTI